MAGAEGSRTFHVSSDAYDRYMGRYSKQLARVFAESVVPPAGGRFLDVGCGPGALTGEAVRLLGPSSVAAADPAPGFAEACRQRFPGVDVRVAPAEELPFSDDEFDAAAAQLVFHFVSDPVRAASEMRRVVRPGGIVAAAVWDISNGMQMLRAFWDAALSIDAAAPDEGRDLPFTRPGQLGSVFADVGLDDVTESTLRVSSEYAGFGELWDNFMAGIGPAGAWATSLPPANQIALRDALYQRLESPTGAFTLHAESCVTTGRVPPS